MIDYKKYIIINISKILNNENILVETPKDDTLGDFSVPCFNLKTESMNPIETAKYIKNNFIDKENYFSNIEIKGPYVNFYLNINILKEIIKEILNNDDYGSSKEGIGKTLLIEHTSINPNASPHIGRSRNALLGDFLSRLYKFNGYNVERHYFINDIGKQIAMLVVGVENSNLDELKFSDILKLYVKINTDSKTNSEIEKKVFKYLNELENGNEEIRNKFKHITDFCVKGQMEILGSLDIKFDIFTHESDYVFSNITKDILDKIKKSNRLKEDENGRYYVDLEGYNIPTKNPVLVLTREDKTSLYPLRDIAYSIYKINRNNENNIIVLGEDQITYMMQISAVLDILGYKSPKLVSYSFVLLDGAKMATRDGTVVLLEDFIKLTAQKLKETFNERQIQISDKDLKIITNATVKYSMLNVSKDKGVNFNLEKATSFNGETGIYILYSIVRINSILSNNKISDIETLEFKNQIEFKILKDLYKFKDIINSLLKTQDPYILTKYIFNLTSKFSNFYEDIKINTETNEILKTSRLKLLLAIKKVLTTSLNIIGISTVDKM